MQRAHERRGGGRRAGRAGWPSGWRSPLRTSHAQTATSAGGDQAGARCRRVRARRSARADAGRAVEPSVAPIRCPCSRAGSAGRGTRQERQGRRSATVERRPAHRSDEGAAPRPRARRDRAVPPQSRARPRRAWRVRAGDSALRARARHSPRIARAPTAPLVADTLDQLASVLIQLERFKDARVRLDESMRIRDRRAAEDQIGLSRTLELVGTLYRYAGPYADAGPPLERALAIRTRLTPTSPRDRVGHAGARRRAVPARRQRGRAESVVERAGDGRAHARTRTTRRSPSSCAGSGSPSSHRGD